MASPSFHHLYPGPQVSILPSLAAKYSHLVSQFSMRLNRVLLQAEVCLPATPETGPQPNTSYVDTIEVALDVTANGRLHLPPYSDDSPSRINNITIFLYSYVTGRNFTITNGTASTNNVSLGDIMQSEPGSTVKHVKWNWPDCLVGDGKPENADSDRGAYNVSAYMKLVETSLPKPELLILQRSRYPSAKTSDSMARTIILSSTSRSQSRIRQISPATIRHAIQSTILYSRQRRSMPSPPIVSVFCSPLEIRLSSNNQTPLTMIVTELDLLNRKQTREMALAVPVLSSRHQRYIGSRYYRCFILLYSLIDWPRMITSFQYTNSHWIAEHSLGTKQNQTVLTLELISFSLRSNSYQFSNVLGCPVGYIDPFSFHTALGTLSIGTLFSDP